MKKSIKKSKKFRSNIGGQAVLEGVMMMGERSCATAVRDETGKIQVESSRFTPIKERSVFRRIPFVRGVINFVANMVTGVKILLRSSEVFEGEVEPGKFEKKLADKFHINLMSIVMFVSLLLGFALAIGLFFVLPQFIIVGIDKLITVVCKAPPLHYAWYNLIEGAIRILIFVGYIALTSLLKDIKRVYMYHGAEHKTISCFEHGHELTIENIQKQSTIHDRCGTTFMFLVMVVSVLLFTFTGLVPTQSVWLKLLVKLALLPVVAGISYEILKFLAKFDNSFVRVIKAPGLLLQKLTTKQPTDEMVEVARTAFITVYEMDRDIELPTSKFNTKELYNKFRKRLDDTLGDIGEGNADADWLCVEVLKVPRSSLNEITHIWSNDSEKILEMAKLRATGMPLQQILKYTNFYGMDIKVNCNVLCPRPETEYLVETCTQLIKDESLTSALDICTGTCAIALVIKRDNPYVKVIATDISSQAIEVAKENILLQGLDIQLVQGDLFENINEKFDLIVSNPPYIESQMVDQLDNVVKEYEPRLALDGGVDGLDLYRRLIAECSTYINDGGYIAFEIGYNQADKLRELLSQDNAELHFSDIKIKQDLEGNDRIVIAKANYITKQ